MRRARIPLATPLLALPLLLGCAVEPLPPEGQLLLFVDTDALLPHGLDEPDDGPAALFDRLRIEIFAPGQAQSCAGCAREFDADHRAIFEGRVSMGLVTPPGKSGYRARVRLYRSGGTDFVEPRPTSTLEAVIALPAVTAEGIDVIHVVLRTEDLGAPRGTLDAPVPALEGPAEGGLAGTWASAFRRDCAGAPSPGEVCVPGGAFWMGSPSFDVPTEHLVVVSPFYLDATEVTVAALRASGLGSAQAVVPFSATAPSCTWTKKKGDFEQLPVNCVTRGAALDLCAARGATLPSEVQLEFASGARRSARSVWGLDPPRCEDAVYARLDAPGQPPAFGECKALGVGVQLPGSGARDRLELAGGTIVDLAGNLAEWVQDVWAEEGEACWSSPLYVDPVCTIPSVTDPGQLAIRGGTWVKPAGLLLAALREKIVAPKANKVSSEIGFRCARAASP